jgi:hypothetical protein
MTKTKTFSASQFVDYANPKHSTAEDKAKFANQFVKFVQGGFQAKDFPKWFYTRLSMTFGHIAHYDQWGFFNVFFEDAAGKIAFINETLNFPCYGDPRFTYSDVEKAIQIWMRENKILESPIKEDRMPVPNFKSWKTEFQAMEGDWNTNGCRFATEQEAKDYGREFLNRAFAFEAFRVGQSTDPVNYTFDWTNGAQPI